MAPWIIGNSLSTNSSLIGSLRVPLVVRLLTYLKDRDGRKQPHKKKDQEHEESKRAGIGCPVPLGGYIDTPRRREKIAVQAGYDDYEALQPHADIHYDRNAPHK